MEAIMVAAASPAGRAAKRSIRLMERPDTDDPGAALHREALVIDICGTTNFALPAPVGADGRGALARARSGGINAVVLTVSAYDEGYEACLSQIARLLHFIEDKAAAISLVTTTEGIRAAQREGKIALVLANQTAAPLETDWVTRLTILARLGLRCTQVTYNEGNRLGSGCLEPADTGLTAYGRQVIAGLNHVGVVPDVAHAGPKTAADVIESSRGPVICSHANAAALTRHPRNLSDDLIRRIADSGGVIGVAAWSPLNRQAPDRTPSIEDYLDHVEHILSVAGPDAVGLGLDLNENSRALPGRSGHALVYAALDPDIAALPQSVAGLDSLDDVPAITAGLLRRGVDPATVTKLLGANFLRVAEQCWPGG
jgi:membrane dipeptidase